MKKCPNCGRVYSDMVSVCSACKTNLSGGSNTAGRSASQSYTPPKTYTPPQSTYTPPQSYTPPQPTYTPPQNYTPPRQSTYVPPQTPTRNNTAFKPDRAGIFSVIVSFLFPVIGLILYLCWKKKRPASAKSVSKAAAFGVIVSVVLNVISRSFADSTDSEPLDVPVREPVTYETPSDNSTPDNLEVGDAMKYNQIFYDRGIVPTITPLLGQETAYYVMVAEDGSLENHQYGYNADTVETWILTLYVPVEGESDPDKAAMDDYVLSLWPGLEQLSFVTIQSDLSSTYYIFSVRMENLNNSENLRAAADTGLMVLDTSSSNGSIDFISMELTEQNLLAQGFIKK